MAIRDIVTLGFGNGTFSPGVNDIPTLGYSIGAAVALVLGPYCIEAGEVFVAGAVAGEIFVAGPMAGEVFVAGAEAGEIHCN